MDTETPDDIPDDEREALLTIGHGAVVTSGGQSLQRALTTATEYALAQGLGPVVYGVYAFAWRITQLLFRLVNFGSVGTLQRYLAAYSDDPDRQGRVVALAYLTTVVVGLVLAGGLFLGGDWLNSATVSHPEFPPTVRLFAALLVLVGLVNIHAGILRAMQSARGEVLFNRVLRPAVRLVGAVGALLLGYSVVGVAGAFVLGMAGLALVGFPVVVSATGIRPVLSGIRSEARRFYNHSGPIALSSLGKVFQNRVDVMLVGFLLTASAAGVYNVVLVLVSLAWIPLLSFNMLLPPVASGLYADDEMTTLNAVYSAVTRLIVTSVVPILVVLLVYGEAILSVFGPSFTAGYVPLVVYLGGVLVGSAVGATGWLLMMTDHQYARMALDWLLAVLNTLLTFAFVRAFGLAGAALGTAVAIAVQNGIQVVLLRRFEGLWPFDATFLKPLGAGTATAGVMFLVRESLAGGAGLVLGLSLGAVTYVGTLVLLGVNDRDRLVVATLASRYREAIVVSLGDGRFRGR
ncbi:lipopolysaccharide biosynthesis protein [Haloarchaeobius iranensis]|uniref:Membrane protein involved in the export of O-antigen and teichoic acid n=2 Tax=Haloarchaeobius iranensis TaxID=996166 RepID=A0A1G9VVE3_9EURY|nr:oligosaccharide flippase family protein [Haloarchaeobius iranensis]SDM76130.1 Membrane protein involved in the export of O-antigen and teichoic acid [Haloarchaeobius iranensis]